MRRVLQELFTRLDDADRLITYLPPGPGGLSDRFLFTDDIPPEGGLTVTGVLTGVASLPSQRTTSVPISETMQSLAATIKPPFLSADDRILFGDLITILHHHGYHRVIVDEDLGHRVHRLVFFGESPGGITLELF